MTVLLSMEALKYYISNATMQLKMHNGIMSSLGVPHKATITASSVGFTFAYVLLAHAYAVRITCLHNVQSRV